MEIAGSEHSSPVQAAYVGHQAVVVGAGVAGMSAAAALADRFERICVVERDTLPDAAQPRAGVPQDLHTHGLLVGGLQALEELFPGIHEDFTRAGAASIRLNRDLLRELPGYGSIPRWDFGYISLAMTRPLLEAVLRQRLARLPNVIFRQATRAIAFVFDAASARVIGVRCAGREQGPEEMLSGDLIVDATGRGQLTIAALEAMGRPLPNETVIGIDLGYTTALVEFPYGGPTDWTTVMTHAEVPVSSKQGVLVPVENGRWTLTAGGFGEERPPFEWNEFLAYFRQLPSQTIYNAVVDAKPVRKIARFMHADSVWRHFERIAEFPDGLIAIGDAICRFNPVYGQGMTTAIKEAVTLGRLLDERASADDPLAGLGPTFFSEILEFIASAWQMSAVPDLAFPHVRGTRPEDLQQSLAFSDAFTRLSMDDEALQKIALEVWHMLKPGSVLENPELVQRVQQAMTDA